MSPRRRMECDAMRPDSRRIVELHGNQSSHPNADHWIRDGGRRPACRHLWIDAFGIDAAVSRKSTGPLDVMFDAPAECMPREELAALQLARLKSTLARAYGNVPLVRAK